MLKRKQTVYFRRPTLALLVTLVLLLVGLSTVSAIQPDAPGLVKVALRSDADLQRVQEAGLPVYSRLASSGGPYLLAGATPAELDSLRTSGLDLVLLDPTISGATYYLVSGRPGLPPAALPGPDAVLFQDGDQAIVRLSPAEAERLTAAGAELAWLPLKPIRLQPREHSALSATIGPDPFVADLVSQVDTADLVQYEEWLTGEEAALIGGEPFTITTRHTYSGTPIQKATQFAYEHLAGLGLEVQYHTWDSSNNPNVIATQRGTSRADEIYILSAHLDNKASGPIVPGADDNASGVTAVLVAADLLSHYAPECTFQYTLWTGEEQGMLGSTAWAEEAGAQELDIRGVLNLDMIAYNSDDVPSVDLHARSWLPESVAIANLFADVVAAYGLDLEPNVLVDVGLGYNSDNSSFWNQGYPAILAIEDHDDFTPYYHTTGDKLSTLNLTYFTEFARAGLAAFLHMGRCLPEGTTGILHGHVTAAPAEPARSSASPIAAATVEMRDESGLTYQATTDGTGYYRGFLPTGIYTVTTSADGYLAHTEAGVVVTAGLTTTLDFSLEDAPLPCVAVHNADFGWEPPMPSVGEAIAFNGAAGGTPPITITWDFGDGAAGRGPAVSHTFDQLGDYLVTMTATNCGREPVVAEHRIRVHIHVRLPLILRGR